MRIRPMRRLLLTATILTLGAATTAPSHAVEDPADTPPETLSQDQVGTQDASSNVTEGPTISAQDLASDKKLDALPEVAGADDIGIKRCDNPYKKWYTVSGKTNYHVPSWWNGTSYKDGPGGTMTVEVLKAGKISVELSGNASAEAGVILSKAKAEFGIKVVAEVGVTVGHRYSRVIKNGRYGHMQYGSWGYKVNWTKWETSADRCGKKKLGFGTAKMPTKEVGWRYWETRS
ncbi:hypothetical protein GCM10009535_16890 [Streptomyces thermocarboxydovorans]|uniref:Uncharacterized protein n=1 Tax=Streptomyces thermocarboxydovorans TaxID=59298 RepID=A0ABP3SI28_9ACTN